MGMPCQQQSLRDSTCQMAWEDSGMEDRNGDSIMLWDSENYCCDAHEGWCEVEDSEFPGDLCEHYQPDLSGEYCDRCGEYLGYGDDEEDDDFEESECHCND